MSICFSEHHWRLNSNENDEFKIKTKRSLQIQHLLHIMFDSPFYLYPTYFADDNLQHEAKQGVFNNRLVLTLWIEDLEAGITTQTDLKKQLPKHVVLFNGQQFPGVLCVDRQTQENSITSGSLTVLSNNHYNLTVIVSLQPNSHYNLTTITI